MQCRELAPCLPEKHLITTPTRRRRSAKSVKYLDPSSRLKVLPLNVVVIDGRAAVVTRWFPLDVDVVVVGIHDLWLNNDVDYSSFRNHVQR